MKQQSGQFGSRRICSLVVGVTATAVGIGMIFLAPVHARDARYVPGELIVKYKGQTAAEIERAQVQAHEALSHSVQILRTDLYQGVLVGLEHLVVEQSGQLPTNMEAIAAELEASGTVEFAEPNYILSLPERANRVASHGKSSAQPQAFPCIIPGIFPPGCELETNRQPTPAPPPAAPALNATIADPTQPSADPALLRMVGFTKLNLSEAWRRSVGSRRVVVGIVDTGIDYNHVDLSGNIWHNPNPSARYNDVVGYNFVHNTSMPFDDQGHGTHVAGTIGAVGLNGVGVSGVAPRVSLMGLKFMDSQGQGPTTAALRAIGYGVEAGAKILNNSWGGGGRSQAIQEVIEKARDAGVLFVAAAGNESNDNDGEQAAYPGSYRVENIVTVAATDANDQLADFSNFGKTSVHLAAPGVRVLSTVPGDRYAFLSGTSMAAPQVSGAAALLLAKHPQWTHVELKRALLGSVDRLPNLENVTITGGRLNILKALE